MTNEGVGMRLKNITIIFNYMKDILANQAVQICLYIQW